MSLGTKSDTVLYQTIKVVALPFIALLAGLIAVISCPFKWRLKRKFKKARHEFNEKFGIAD